MIDSSNIITWALQTKWRRRAERLNNKSIHTSSPRVTCRRSSYTQHRRAGFAGKWRFSWNGIFQNIVSRREWKFTLFSSPHGMHTRVCCAGCFAGGQLCDCWGWRQYYECYDMVMTTRMTRIMWLLLLLLLLCWGMFCVSLCFVINYIISMSNCISQEPTPHWKNCWPNFI